MYWGQFILFSTPNWLDTINGYCSCWVLAINSAYSHSTYKKNKLETKLSSATGDEHGYIDTRIQKATIVSNMADRMHRSTDRKKERERENRKAQTRHRTGQGRLDTGWITNESSIILLLLFMIAGFWWKRHDTRRLFPFHGVVSTSTKPAEEQIRANVRNKVYLIYFNATISPSAESLCCGEHIWGIQ